MTLHQSMRGIVRSKEIAGVGESTEYRGDPRLLVIDWDNNARPLNEEHVAGFQKSIRAGTYIPRVLVKVIDSKMHVVDGRHRATAFLRCIAEGDDIQTIELAEFKGSDADEVLLMLTTASGLPLTPLQMGDQYARLEKFGWTIAQIADKCGKGVPHVTQMIELTRAPSEIQAMVARREVSATQASKTIKKHGSAAKEVRGKAMEQARAAGKERITKKAIEPKPAGVSLEESIRIEMKSNGVFRAEISCPEHADLIAWLRGTGKEPAMSMEMENA